MYRSVCDMANEGIRKTFQVGNEFLYPPPHAKIEPCSMDALAHYSFDMAEQVHYPSNPLQPGPVYFLTPRKCGIFGVYCEAIPRQMNYLIDEACNSGKGSNAIVSMLHHFFDEHGLGEREVHLHADNCVRQNKTIRSCSTFSGERWLGCTNASPFPSCLLSIPHFPPIGVLAFEVTTSPLCSWFHQ